MARQRDGRSGGLVHAHVFVCFVARVCARPVQLTETAAKNCQAPFISKLAAKKFQDDLLKVCSSGAWALRAPLVSRVCAAGDAVDRHQEARDAARSGEDAWAHSDSRP